MMDPTPSAPVITCQAGHERHAVRRARVVLGGQPVVWDYPAIPERLARTFDMYVYDYEQYEGFAGWCPGQDDFNRSLVLNGTWEGYETLVMMEVLARGTPGAVLDFGANLGWYSLIAAAFGYKVTAYDACQEDLDHLKASAALGGWDVRTVHKWFDAGARPAAFRGDVAFLKADVEGAEAHVVRYCQPLFAGRRVHYALIEVSPCFNESYPALVRWIMAQGYDAYVMPTKPAARVKAAFEADVWDALRRFCRVEDVSKTFEGMYQENLLFARKEA